MKPVYKNIYIPNRPWLENCLRLDGLILPIISRMESVGMGIDKPYMADLYKRITHEMDSLAADVERITGYSVNLGSGDQVADLLFTKLRLKQQGKEKKTKSKARLAADSDVLRGMISKHDCIPVILAWKQREKLRSSFTLSLIEQADSNGRIHCDLNHTGPETGRLSCNSPNLQTIPVRSKLGREIRNAFVPAKGNILGTVDACLHPNTKIKTVRGPIDISKLEIGDAVLTYRNQKISYGRVSKKSHISPKLSYKLTFDNGESVIASYDHRWPVLEPRGYPQRSNPRIQTTEELVIGDRMIPCREGHTGTDRKTWYSRSSFEYTPQHVLIADAVYGPRPCGYDVHHKDEDCSNNDPSNLEYKEHIKHLSDHGKEKYRRQDHKYRIDRLRVGIQNRRDYHGDNNPNSKLDNKSKKEVYRLALAGWSARDISNAFPISYGYARRLVVIATTGRDYNHRLVKKEIVGIQPMYAITVEPDHNYVLECGVVTMNSQIEMRTMCNDARCSKMMELFQHGEDLYWGVAEGMYKRKFSDDERKHGVDEGSGQKFSDYFRFNAKTTALGVTYDISPEGLVDLFLTAEPPAIYFLTGGDKTWDYDRHYRKAVDICGTAIKDFFMEYQEILVRRREHHRRAKVYGFVWDMWGRIRWIPQVRSTHNWIVGEGLRAAGNLAGQGGAAGLIKLWMARMWERIDEYWDWAGIRPLMSIHDETLVEGPKQVVIDFLEESKYILESLIPDTDLFCVPIAGKSDYGERWGELK